LNISTISSILLALAVNHHKYSVKLSTPCDKMNHKALAISLVVTMAVILFVGSNIGIIQAQSGGIINDGGKRGPP
jgi:hypothetical protein